MQKKVENRGSWFRHWAWRVLAIIILAGGAYLAWRHVGPEGGRLGWVAHREQVIPAPVHVAIVQQRDVPVILAGLGTVQPSNAVTIRSRVDGQIETVAFAEGQIVHKGDLLVQIDPAPYQAALDQAKAKLAQDQANLTSAKLDLQRTSTLAKKGDATQQQLDQQIAKEAQLSAQVQGDQAAIESARVQLAYTTIRSPLTGRAGFRLIDPGNIVHASDQSGMLTITQLSPISVIFTAPEARLAAIRESLKAGPLQVTALTSDGKRTLGEGTLSLIDNQVDVASGTVRLKASFDNADNALWPGLSVSTRLLLTTLQNVVAVPDVAVQRGPRGLFAYVVTKDGKAELRNLQVGHIQNGWAVVDRGLGPGELIITSGYYRVEPGLPVAVLDDRSAASSTVGEP